MSISHLFQLQTGLSHQFEGIHAFKHSDLVLKWCEKALAPLGCFRKVFRWFILEWGTKYWCAYYTIESRMTTMSNILRAKLL